MGNHTGTIDDNIHVYDEDVEDRCDMQAFSVALRQKMDASRDKGRGGWRTCPPDRLRQMLAEHVQKGDPRDVALFCMMLWRMGERTAASQQKDANHG